MSTTPTGAIQISRRCSCFVVSEDIKVFVALIATIEKFLEITHPQRKNYDKTEKCLVSYL